MKKFLSLLLCVLLLCTVFSGCGEEADSGKLVICVDISKDYVGETSTDALDPRDQAIEFFRSWIDRCRTAYGLDLSSSEIEFEVIPGAEKEPAERSAMLQRIRSAIMAGKGPDVFICSTLSGNGMAGQESTPMPGGRLFPFVENTRESGLFLPLDDLFSDMVITDVNDLIPQVMEGGKNEKGEQVLIPLIFSVPGILFPGADAPKCDFEGTSWNDLLKGDDPLLAEQSVWAVNFNGYNEEGIREGYHSTGLSYLFPKVADFQTGQLTFSEEELLTMVKDSLSAYRQLQDRETQQKSKSTCYSLQQMAYGDFDVPEAEKYLFTFSPLRNLASGSTALVSSYCAINANTKKKEKALAVLDALLCKDYQLNGTISGGGMKIPTFHDFLGSKGMLMNRELGPRWNLYPDVHFLPSEDADWQQDLEELNRDFQRICEDINVVRFPSPLDSEIDAMMMEIEDTMLTVRSPYNPEVIWRDGQFIFESISDEELERIVSEHYQTMQRLLDES